LNIEELEGVIPALASKLRDVGINTVENLITYTSDAIAEMLGIKKEEAERIMVVAWPTVEFSKKIGEEMVFTTGSKAFDKLLGGGIRTRQITEL